MNKLFKPMSKRDAKIVSVIIGAAIIAFTLSLIKELLSGQPFEEIKTSIMLLVFLVIIEYAMLTTAFGKDKNSEETEAKYENDIDGKDQH